MPMTVVFMQWHKNTMLLKTFDKNELMYL